MCFLCVTTKGRTCTLLHNKGCLYEFLKNVEFEFKKLTSCFPLSRKDKFVDVIGKGTIDKIWLIPGHVLILNQPGKELLTFDCKPAHLQQFEGTVFLDLIDIKSEIIDILTAQLYPKCVFIAFIDGTLEVWKYTNEHTWSGVLEVNIRSTSSGEVVSVCINEDHAAIYWCEKSNGTYSICKRQLPKDLEELNEKSVGKEVVILSNCPQCDVFQLKDFIFISTRHSVSQVQLYIIWRPSSDHVTLFVGGVKLKIDSTWTNHKIDFRNIGLRCLPTISKVDLPYCETVTIQDSLSEELISIGNDGKVQIFHVDQEEIGSVTMTSLELPSSLSNLKRDNCFVRNGFLGVVGTDSIRLFSLHTGQLLQDVHIKDKIIGIIDSANPVYIGGILTKSDLYVLQKITRRDQLVEQISDSVKFQTKALQYAHFSQTRQYCEESGKKLDELKKVWEKERTDLPKSQLTQTIAPFIEEFWRLEDLSNEKQIESNLDKTDASKTVEHLENLESEVNAIVSGSLNVPLSWQQSQLLILSEKYPEDVINILLHSLNLEEDSVSDNEMEKWKKILGLDMTDPGNQKTFIFNHICRLIFKLRPQYLVKFVKMAQIVSEKNIGVSAFVRRRHLLQYYQKALDCLPEPDTSTQPKRAVEAHSQLLIACGDKNCMLKTVKYLVKHEHWMEVFNVLQQEMKEVDVKEKSMFIYILITALAKKGLLLAYCKELSSLVPNWKDSANFENIFEENGKVATMTSNSPDYPAIASIQPILGDLLKDI